MHLHFLIYTVKLPTRGCSNFPSYCQIRGLLGKSVQRVRRPLFLWWLWHGTRAYCIVQWQAQRRRTGLRVRRPRFQSRSSAHKGRARMSASLLGLCSKPRPSLTLASHCPL